MPFVDRTTFIDLLEKLRAEDEADVVSAAREIARRMDEGGVTWDQVLVDPDRDDADDDDGDDDVLAEPVSGEQASGAGGMIDTLLARDDLSDELREELEGYKEDIAEGEFTAADAQYVSALAKRLG